MKALVTGGVGFIGSNLISKLKTLKFDIVSIDNYSTGKKENEVDGVTYIKMDIEQIETLKNKVNVCFHLAGQSRVTSSFHDPQESFRINFSGTKKVMEWARKNKVKVIYAGSASRHQDILSSPYSLSKYMGEEICKLYKKHYAVNVEITRFYNVYGPLEVRDESNGNVIGIWLNRVSKGLPLNIIGDGNQKRDFIHVYDIVDALIKISKTNYKHDDAWELGSGNSISINNLFNIFKNKFDVQSNYLKDKPGNFKFATRKDDKMLDKISWKPNSSKLVEYINTVEI